MQLTKEEIRLAVYSVVIGEDGQAKKYETDKLPIATTCFKLLNSCVNEDEEKTYKDSDIELNTASKTFLLECLNRKWAVADGLFVLSLKEKLEK